MFRNYIFSAILMATGFLSWPVAASTYDTENMKLVVETLEIDKLRISLNDSLNGYLLGKQKKRLIITPATEAYENGRKVPLLEARKQRFKHANASYDIKTGKVVRISWWNIKMKVRR